MAIPEFIVDLRKLIGHQQLWLPAVTAVIRRGEEILLVKRSDNGRWSPVTGVVDPGEDPGIAARRESREETGVEITVDRLASVQAMTPTVHDNGDQAIYLDHTFTCTYVSGEAHVADEESSEVGWFHRDALPEMHEVYRARIDIALADEVAARFIS